MIVAALTQAVDDCAAAGIRATYDPRNLAVPGALVTCTGYADAGQCAYDVDVDTLLIAPGPANGDAVRALDSMARAYDATHGAHTGELVGYEHAATGELLAAVRITRTLTVHTA